MEILKLIGVIYFDFGVLIGCICETIGYYLNLPKVKSLNEEEKKKYLLLIYREPNLKNFIIGIIIWPYDLFTWIRVQWFLKFKLPHRLKNLNLKLDKLEEIRSELENRIKGE